MYLTGYFVLGLLFEDNSWYYSKMLIYKYYSSIMNQFKLVCTCCLLVPFLSYSQIAKDKVSASKNAVEWKVCDLLFPKSEGIRLAGKPEIGTSQFGKTLVFNGSDNGIFLDQMPLAGMKKFSIEAIIKPESGGNFEQRFFHCGEIRGNRVLMELRSVLSNWYFDAFIKSEDQQKTLIDSTKLHPLNQWYHLAFVNDNGKLTTFINGKKELESQIDFVPLQSGKTSIGVRLNELSWFRGAIYKIRISPEAVDPANFMKD